jgi:spermidine/putrescine transport system permease protein
MSSLNLPAWSFWLMGAGLAIFVLMLVKTIRQTKGIKRSFYAWPYTLWMIISTVVPLILIAYYALTDKSGSFTLENFITFWDSNHAMKKELLAQGFDPEMLGMGARGMVNIDTLIYSLWMAFLCTGISLLVGYPAALIMADREFKLGSTIVVLFIIPMWMNFLLRTIAWMSLLEDNGLINTLLQLLGFGKARLMYNSQAVLLGMVYNYLPFMVFPIYNSLSRQDSQLSEAAMDLGANKWRTFWRVVFPISMPGIVSGITMVFMPSVTTFFIPRVLGGGNTEMFGDLIERTFLTADDWNVGSAMSLVMMVLILLSLGLLRKVDPEGEGGGLI